MLLTETILQTRTLSTGPPPPPVYPVAPIMPVDSAGMSPCSVKQLERGACWLRTKRISLLPHNAQRKADQCSPDNDVIHRTLTPTIIQTNLPPSESKHCPGAKAGVSSKYTQHTLCIWEPLCKSKGLLHSMSDMH